MEGVKVKVSADERRQLAGHVIVHVIVPVPGRLRCIQVESGAETEVPRTVGVVNLIGRQDGSRFSAANQKLLAAIASQVGAAIENNRLVRESLSKERMAFICT